MSCSNETKNRVPAGQSSVQWAAVRNVSSSTIAPEHTQSRRSTTASSSVSQSATNAPTSVRSGAGSLLYVLIAAAGAAIARTAAPVTTASAGALRTTSCFTVSDLPRWVNGPQGNRLPWTAAIG